MGKYATTLFEAPILVVGPRVTEAYGLGDFEYTDGVYYDELSNYRDEVAEVIECYDNGPWPDDRDDFARMTDEYNELKELLKALNHALNEFNDYENLIHEYDFDDWAYDRFLECYGVSTQLETYLDKEKIVRDMGADFGMTTIGFPDDNKQDFYIT